MPFGAKPWLAMLVVLVSAGCAGTPPVPALSLFDRLGGMEKITIAATRLVDTVSRDPRTSRSFEGVNLTRLKASVATHLCMVAAGPCRYEGETMAAAHTGMSVTDAEFDVMGGVLAQAFLSQGAHPTAVSELDALLSKMRPEIVGK